MRVLLINTYELGHQPVHVASPAAALLACGHEVRALDLAVQPWDRDLVAWAERVAISVPMHTAMRLGVEVARRLRYERPGLPVALYGLYAGMSADRTAGTTADRLFIGEYQPALVEWAAGSDRGGSAVRVGLGRGRFEVPARHLLPPLDRYATLQMEGERRLVGAVETSHGCRHRCRHCPIPAVYDGRLRIVAPEIVLGDVEQLVSMGARHVTFADPDFLNGPAHSVDVLRRVHDAFPELTMDVTVKVEHILARAGLWPELARLGVVFVVSAFETVNDRILALLDKGHTVGEMGEAVHVLGAAGIAVRPSWLPFTPWTTAGDITGIFSFLEAHDLLGSTDPVQLSIRLLIPEGSLLLELPELRPHLGEYDLEALTYRWAAGDPAMDDLQSELAELAADDADRGEPAETTLAAMWERAAAGTGAVAHAIPAGAAAGRPHLTEPWFC